MAILVLKLHLPSHYVILEDREDSAQVLDEQNQVVWYFFLFTNLHVNLQEDYREELEKSLHLYAKSMFSYTEETQAVNPEWTPIVDIEYLNIGSTDILRTVHRMAIRPGEEVVMGHLLIPVQQGLFEGRVVSVDTITGHRESTLMMPILQNLSMEELQNLQRPDFDSPIHDSQFPEHCLSRNRTGLRWLINNLYLSKPSPALRHDRTEIPHLGCSIVSPPRFVIDTSNTSEMAQKFSRVSFCGTDGLESFVVNSLGKFNFSSQSKFLDFVEDIIPKIFQDLESINTQILSPHNQQHRLLAFAEKSQTRYVLLFFFDIYERLWFLNWCANSIVPVEKVIKYLEDSMNSLRLINT